VRSICPQVRDFLFDPALMHNLLEALGEWCLRFTPLAGVDTPDGLMLDISGCTHLWGGEAQYLATLVSRLTKGGYTVHAAIADTLGAAWGMARYGKESFIAAPGKQAEKLCGLPPAALRLEATTIQRMHKLGFHTVAQFIDIP